MDQKSIFIKKDFVDFVSSNALHTEQCLSLLKNYLPLLPIEYVGTVKKLEEMTSVCVENNKKVVSLVEKIFNVEKRREEKHN